MRYKITKSLFTFLLVALLMGLAVADNPLVRFKNTTMTQPLPDEIWVVHGDISGDGLDEIFVSDKRMLPQRTGVWWVVYTPVDGQYVRLYDQNPHFHRLTINIGGRDGTEAALYSYSPGGGGQGALVRISLRNGKIITETVKTMTVDEGAGPDLEEFETLFKDSKRMLTTIPYDEVDTFDFHSLVPPLMSAEGSGSGFETRSETDSEVSEPAGNPDERIIVDDAAGDGRIRKSKNDSQSTLAMDVEPETSRESLLALFGCLAAVLFVGGVVVLRRRG